MTTHKRYLTRPQRSNLDKLATYLEGLPEDYSHFDMMLFIGDEEGNMEDWEFANYARRNGGVAQFGCGTVACAVGHGPAAGVLFRGEFETIAFWEGKRKVPNWNTYSRRFAPTGTEMWCWLFDSDWTEVDPHHWGAAARIRFILAGNEVPYPVSNYQLAGFSEIEIYEKFRKHPMTAA